MPTLRRKSARRQAVKPTAAPLTKEELIVSSRESMALFLRFLGSIGLFVGAYLSATLLNMVGNPLVPIVTISLCLVLLFWAIALPESVRQAARQRRMTVEVRYDEPNEDDDGREKICLAGDWCGTLRLWPASGEGTLQMLPVALRWGERLDHVGLLPVPKRHGKPRVVAARVVRFDEYHGALDVSLTVEFDQEGRLARETYRAQLDIHGARLVPSDLSSRCTLDMQRQAEPVARQFLTLTVGDWQDAKAGELEDAVRQTRRQPSP